MRYNAEELRRRRRRAEQGENRTDQTAAEQFAVQPLAIDIHSFAGPYDLLNHLIDQNKYHWYDIPLADITGQYLSVLKEMRELDLDLAGDFSVMAATLIHLKSRLLLPSAESDETAAAADPGEELVLQLLAYRRCKFVAGELARRMAIFDHTCPSAGLSAAAVGVDRLPKEGYPPLDPAKFYLAVNRVESANRARYQDLSDRVTRLLQRETVSLTDKIVQIWDSVRRRGKLLFSSLFHRGAGKTEKITGFLALLELVKRQFIQVEQAEPFAPIMVEVRAEAGSLPDDELLENAIKEYQ